MQLIINIDRDIYNFIKKTGRMTALDMPIVANNIIEGKQLPKRHGRLIDESEINFVSCHMEEAICENLKYSRLVVDYTDAPTILEAKR